MKTHSNKKFQKIKNFTYFLFSLKFHFNFLVLMCHHQLSVDYSKQDLDLVTFILFGQLC